MVSKGGFRRFPATLLLGFLVVPLTSMIPYSFAVEQNGVIQMPFTENPPTIDGKWTSADEWKDASRTTMGSENNIAFLYSEHDRDYLYVMIDFVSDQTKSQTQDNTKSREGALLYFDTNNDGSAKLDSDDYIFDLVASETCCANMRLFKVIPTDNGQVQLAMDDPPTGSLYEAGFGSLNDPNEGGRDHRIYEFRIPFSFLHKQDKFGFSAIALDSISQTSVVWPTNADYSMPSTTGTIMAPNHSVSAPPLPVISLSTQTLSFGNTEVSGKSNPQTVTISNIGTGLLKISSVQTTSEFSVSGIDTPVDISPNKSVSFNVILAPITLGDKSGLITIYSNDPSNPASSVSISGTGVEKAKSPFGGKCLIATAAFGSELSPQVQLLRDFRDHHVLQTKDGSSFMSAFNAWYYSFSPYVADYERDQPWMQQIVRVAIYPLLGILTASEKAYSILPGEYGSMSAGLVASSLIGAVYFWPFALAAPQVRKGNRLNYKLAAISFAAVSTATVLSIIVGNEIAMMVTTSLFVLTLVGIFATISAKTVVKAVKKFI